MRAQPSNHADAPRPAPGNPLPPRPAWTASKDRAAATHYPPAGTPHRPSCRRPGSQPGSWTEIRLGARAHTPLPDHTLPRSRDPSRRRAADRAPPSPRPHRTPTTTTPRLTTSPSTDKGVGNERCPIRPFGSPPPNGASRIDHATGTRTPLLPAVRRPRHYRSRRRRITTSKPRRAPVQPRAQRRSCRSARRPARRPSVQSRSLRREPSASTCNPKVASCTSRAIIARSPSRSVPI